MIFLKQSTEVIARFGPYIDKTDGFTEETGLAGASTEISKNHGAFGAGPVLGAHDADGWYPITLTTTHTDTIGPFIIKGHDNATHLPVWLYGHVLAANVYDSIFGAATDKLQVDAVEWLSGTIATPTVTGVPEVDLTHMGGVAQSAADLKDFADDGYDPATNKVQGVVLTDTVTTYTGNTVQTGDSFARLGAPAGASVSADIAAVKSDTAAILTDTGTTLQAELDGIQADTEDIQTRLPAVLVSGRIDASVGAMAANVLTASALAADAVAEIVDAVWDELRSGHSVSGSYGESHFAIYSGQVSGATTTTTLIDSGLTEADTDHWKGRIIIFIDGTLKYQATDITAFDPATDTLTFTTVTTAPTAGPGGSRYIII